MECARDLAGCDPATTAGGCDTASMNEHLDWQECADEYEASRQRITDLVSELDDVQLATTVPACPDWSVWDACAHCAAIPASILVGDVPGHDDGDAWVTRTIADRAGRSIGEVLDEWAEVAPAFEAQMVERGGQLAGMVLDVVAHEHDIRHAVGRPGARDTAGIVQSLGFTKLIMDRDLAAGAPGTVVRFACDDGTWQAGGSADAEPTITLDLSGRLDGTFELVRALGSRRSEDQLDTLPWSTDWRPHRAGIFHMPLPEAPLDE